MAFDLPKTLCVEGEEYEIDTAWRTWAKIGAEARKMNGAETLARMLVYCYGTKLPKTLDAAARAMVWFYKCGKTDEESGTDAPSGKAVFDIEYDFGYVRSAFLHAYGIDLRESNLHWWAFWEMFQALGEDEKIIQIISWRSAVAGSIKNKERRQFIRKMQRLYKLPDERSEEEKERSIADVIEKSMMGG